MTTALAALGVAAVLGCPLHMLWRMRHGRRASCMPGPGGSAGELGDRQRALAERIEALAGSEANIKPTPGRH